MTSKVVEDRVNNILSRYKMYGHDDQLGSNIKDLVRAIVSELTNYAPSSSIKEDNCDLRLIPVCEACESGEEGICHTPGCSFWMRDAPKERLQYWGMPTLPSRESLRSIIDEVFPIPHGPAIITQANQLDLADQILSLLGKSAVTPYREKR